VEWVITVVVLVNCSAVILDSIPEVHAEYKDFFHELEFWSVMFFTLEYVLRVWSLGAKFTAAEGGAWKGRKGYIFSPFGLIDFFATMPFFLHVFFPTLDLRILRVLRLLRILKLSKYNTALQDLFTAVNSEGRAFGSAAFLLLIATIVSASLMHFAEGHEQPQHFGSIPHYILGDCHHHRWLRQCGTSDQGRGSHCFIDWLFGGLHGRHHDRHCGLGFFQSNVAQKSRLPKPVAPSAGRWGGVRC
jgi:hypothetical protein